MNKIIAIVLGIFAVIMTIITKNFGYLAYIIFLIVPFILKLDKNLTLIYIIFTFMSYFWGSTYGLYRITTWYDSLSHFIWGILSGLVALYFLHLFNKNDNFLFNLIFIILFSLGAAALWEIFEFACDRIFHSNMQRIETGLYDTMKDMITSTLGTILFIILYIIEHLEKKGIITYFEKGWLDGRSNIRTIKKRRKSIISY